MYPKGIDWPSFIHGSGVTFAAQESHFSKVEFGD